MSDYKTLQQAGPPPIPLRFFGQDNDFSEQEDSCCRLFLTQRDNDLGIPNFLSFNEHQLFFQARDIYQEENYDFLYPMALSFGSGIDHQEANCTPGISSTNSEDYLAPHPQLSSSEVVQKEFKCPEYLEEKSVIQSESSKKRQKNQYDKNIAGNICSTVIKKMVSPPNQKEIRFYCKNFEVSYRQFTEYFRSLLRKEKRFGTSELYNFFSKNEDTGFQKVFGLFLTRFLNEDYLAYILSIGKMSNQKKYLECAINLMYIPKLNIQQTNLISQFHKLV